VPFCREDSQAQAVSENGTVLAIEDKYPVTKGHVLIVTRRHAADWFAMTELERQPPTSSYPSSAAASRTRTPRSRASTSAPTAGPPRSDGDALAHSPDPAADWRCGCPAGRCAGRHPREAVLLNGVAEIPAGCRERIRPDHRQLRGAPAGGGNRSLFATEDQEHPPLVANASA
jgi:hypothetical protein